jgi:hypothetical protein
MNLFLTSVCDSANRRGALREFCPHDMFRQGKADPRQGFHHLWGLRRCNDLGRVRRKLLRGDQLFPWARHRCLFACEPEVSGAVVLPHSERQVSRPFQVGHHQPVAPWVLDGPVHLRRHPKTGQRSHRSNPPVGCASHLHRIWLLRCSRWCYCFVQTHISPAY